uniref:Queuosine salvage protein n=1 Tax=Angiostrongylus cantonensis TaxID=6313 RepID=A0A0K0D274_ANGCA
MFTTAGLWIIKLVDCGERMIQSKPIVCQPFVSKVAIENFLEDIIRKKALKSNAAKRASVALDQMRRIQRRHSFDYESERDQDTGNLWYYFHDNLWNKTHFPKSLNYVDIMNSYFTSASGMLKQLPNTALALRLFPLLRKNPWNANENLLLHGGVSNTLQLTALEDVPLFVATEDGFLNDEIAENIAAGRGLSMLVKYFIEFVRDQFASGLELVKPGDNIERVIGTQLVPAYKYIELTLLYGKESLEDDVRRNMEADMTRMLDRLCVAYQLAQIRFDLERPNHELSFVGISKKLSNSLFDEWDIRKYGRHSLNLLENSVFHGKMVINNADVKEVMSILNSAGLKADDVKVEIIATNLMDEAPQKFSSEELRVLRELIDRQMDDIRDMTRINKREQAYQTMTKLHPFEVLEKDYYMGEEATGGGGRESDEELRFVTCLLDSVWKTGE